MPLSPRSRLISTVAAALSALAILPSASLAAPTSTPNDPFFAGNQQWALNGVAAGISAPQAWCVSTGAGILIADLDTGADFSHPDLSGKLTAGAAFLSGDGSAGGSVQDDVGHGTQTVGVMIAVTNNKQGIAAVAPDARALVIKVLKRKVLADGTVTADGYPKDLNAGIRYAVGNGARVINISIGSTTPMGGADAQAFAQTVHDAAAAGVALAIAAGDGNEVITNDAAQVAADALLVGGLASNGSKGFYSTNTPTVNIWAPGGDQYQGGTAGEIVSTALQSGGAPYRATEGTSIASPHVAGVLAQLMATGFSASQARQRVLSTATSRGGLPEVNGAAALGALATCPVVPSPPRSSASPTGPVALIAPPSPSPSASASPSPSGAPLATPSPAPPSSAVARSTSPLVPLLLIGLVVLLVVLGAVGVQVFLSRRRRARAWR